MFGNWLIYRRLPWILAADPRDCGASVFASLARFHGHHVTLEEARGLVGTDRDGTTLAGLRDGGRAIGLEAHPAHATYEALGEIPLPAIVHLKHSEGHYLVLYRWTPAGVVVLDPNHGVRRLRRTEFEAVWSGYLVVYRPTPALTAKAPSFHPRGRFLGLVGQHKPALLVALVAALVATSLGWLATFFLQVLFDRILPNRDERLLVALGTGLVLVSGIQAGLQFGRLWLAAIVGRHMHQDYGARYIRHLMRLPMKVFDARCVPGLVMRITQAEQIQLAATESGVLLVADVAMFVATLGIICVYDPVAALIAAAAAPLILIATVVLNERVQATQLAAMVRQEEFGSQMVDTFDALRTIKIFSAEGRYQRALEARLDALTRARRENRVAMALPIAWSWLATSLVTAAILWYGSHAVLTGRMTAGDLLVLFGMMAFYLTPVQRFPATVLLIRAALLGVERLEEIGALPEEAGRTTDPTSLPVVRGRIEFDRVSFGYKRHRPVLKDVSFAIEAGETVAVVGETGSGKTTLANLIAGFYLPTAGEVRIDGVGTQRIEPEHLRRSISAVFQDAKLLQQSVAENITLLAEAPLEDVVRVARLANADDFIAGLYNGYDAQVARFGENFSAGQAQRIALARALLKDAPILLLDEATSNLDGATEQGILRALEENRRGRTTVVIAHRLGTVVNADRIVVMADGEVVETGTHAELWARGGRYFELFRAQVGLPVPPVVGVGESVLATGRVA
ncbi:MAG TPA: peptidase domain-containing ABC transporter [Thermomicrobiales bacterium]|jgi:ABC-type bacteriocin/lantibiotic exporter with double-glycine peptidase domain